MSPDPDYLEDLLNAPEPFATMRIGDMARLVDSLPPPRFIVRRLLVEGDYGVIGADKKFGKTFLAGDLGVNVAAGGSFLGAFPIDVAGTVLLFAGEGGKRKIVRRCRAIARHYCIDLDDIPLHVYERAPKLGDLVQVERFRATVDALRPVLTIVDPAYLAVSGAETHNLVGMGVLLERAQHVCQEVGSALLMTHHWNKTGQGSTADRFTGSGWAEWGRVLISGSTLSRSVDKLTGASRNVLKLEVVGDETVDTEITFRRQVWVEDPDDLTSPMHYVCEIVENEEAEEADEDTEGLRPAAKRILTILRAHPDRWLDHVEIGDKLADNGFPLKKRTILEGGQSLVAAGLAADSGGDGNIR